MEIEVKPVPSSSLSIQSAERLYVIEEFPMKRIIGSFAAMLIFSCAVGPPAVQRPAMRERAYNMKERMFTCNTLDDE